MPLFILFVVVPVVEITLLIKVGQQIGAWYTVALVLLSAFIGVNMLRHQGLSTLLRARSRIEEGEIPLSEMRDGILIAMGGALLITPGFVTDALGFALLIPFTRSWLYRLFGRHLQSFIQVRGGQAGFNYQYHQRTDASRNQGSDEVIEGEFVDLDQSKPQHRDDSRRLH